MNKFEADMGEHQAFPLTAKSADTGAVNLPTFQFMSLN